MKGVKIVIEFWEENGSVFETKEFVDANAFFAFCMKDYNRILSINHQSTGMEKPNPSVLLQIWKDVGCNI